MRYPIADYFLFRFMTRFASRYKIFFEHNTLEEEELKLRSEKSDWYRYFYWSERFFGKPTRKKASGLICVTSEIEKRQSRITGGAVPTVTISNGIDVSRTTIKSPRQGEFPDTLNILFLAGSEAPWHGVDILLNSLHGYNGTVKVHCYIAGSIDERSRERVSSMSQVTLFAHLEGDALDAMVEKSHIGIGSLALFRNNMTEACTLKVREYWARGLPIVLGYDDTDLMNNAAMKPFVLKVNISPDPLPVFDFNSVVSFADGVLKIANLNTTIRSQALATVHYPVKAGAYLSFFKSVLE
jgi:hypothetical protein